MLSTDTLQYSDYDQYESAMFDKEAKLKRHAEVFPEDCKRALQLGVRMASGKVRLCSNTNVLLPISKKWHRKKWA